MFRTTVVSQPITLKPLRKPLARTTRDHRRERLKGQATTLSGEFTRGRRVRLASIRLNVNIVLTQYGRWFTLDNRTRCSDYANRNRGAESLFRGRIRAADLSGFEFKQTVAVMDD
jgi:hypothetical protein